MKISSNYEVGDLLISIKTLRKKGKKIKIISKHTRIKRSDHRRISFWPLPSTTMISCDQITSLYTPQVIKELPPRV